MAKRIIKQGIEARTSLASGAEKLAKAVASTLGPFGQNWFLDKKNAVTNDGVTIAREFQLEDEVENRGVAAIREAAIKTVEEAGDGTSTAVVLANGVYKAMSKFMSKEGVIGKKPSELIKQVEKEKKEVLEKLVASATPITTEEELVNSAIVSTEDRELGALIGKAQFQLGKDGYLLAEESAEPILSLDIVRGIRIDNGFGTSQIINNQEKQTLEVEDTKVILTSHTIKTLTDWQKIMKICEMLAKSGITTVTIIARAWTDEAVNYCLQNINRGTIKIYPLSAPYVDMQERFKDMQAVLGGRFLDSESSDLTDLQLSDLGFAKKVIARRWDAIITGKEDEQTQERITKRVTELTEKRKGSQSEFEKKNISERLAQLTNGFGIIKVGASSDMERRRLFDKADDAVNAVRAAFQEGTVKGAGLAYKEIADSMPDDAILKQPLKLIYEEITSSAPADFVIEDWVRDPLKVMRVALERACSAAASFATATGVITIETPKGLNEVFQKQLAQNQSGE